MDMRLHIHLFASLRPSDKTAKGPESHLGARGALLLSAMFGAGGGQAAAPVPEAAVLLPSVEVSGLPPEASPSEKSGNYSIKRSRSATGLNLSPRETPQSLSIVSHAQMRDFGLNNVNSALSSTAGVTVERVETDRTYYTARGFDITNFQTDGVGVPFIYGNVDGDLDTVVYDRIETVYGANGLISPTGFPSATINFIRKRPTTTFAAEAGISAGSWKQRRVDADISGPINATGSVRARIVAASERTDSYLDRNGRDKQVFYGVVEADVGDQTLLTVGHSDQRNEARSPLYGALPLLHSDGSPTRYSRSTSTAPGWSYWNSRTRSSFADLTHDFADGWAVRFHAAHNHLSNDSELLYVYGTPDPNTGTGLFAYPSRYEMHNRQQIVESSIGGPFAFLGRRHEMQIGLGASTSRLHDRSDDGQGIGNDVPPLEGWNGDYAKPTFDAGSTFSRFEDRRRSAWAVARWNLSDTLKLITGLRRTRAANHGIASDVPRDITTSRNVPYAGLVYDVHPTLSIYASATRLFHPQHETDQEGQALGPVAGRSHEIGVKGEFFDKSLQATLAVFRAEQRNLAEAAGTVGLRTFYRGIDAESRGVQLDLAGKIGEHGQINLGSTVLSLRDPDGEAVRTYVPRRLLRLATNWAIAGVPGLKVGARLNWQSAIRATYQGFEIRQGAYAVAGLTSSYALDRHTTLSMNVDNLTDKKYVSSLYWGGVSGQGFYGAPRNISVSLHWKL